jgi:ATP-dependent Clp protease adaptor protein ClpS
MSVTVRDPNAVDSGIGTDGVCQVVLFNDNHNSFDHVILSLIAVFGHNEAIAKKVAMEAHTTGKSVAEVEEAEKALLHKEMLETLGLTSEIEKI